MAENDKPTDADAFEAEWRETHETIYEVAQRLGIARARVANLLEALKPAHPRPAKRETGEEDEEV